MATALFISRTDLVKSSIVDGNVDTDKFIQFVKIAQEIHIQNYLGSKLYDKISSDIIADTLTGNYLSLVTDYVQPMLIHYAMADLLLFHGYEVTNAGILRNSPENTTLPDKTEIDTLVQRQRNIAETYRRRVVDYLSYYPQLFSQYTEDQQAGEYPNTNPSNYVSWNL